MSPITCYGYLANGNGDIILWSGVLDGPTDQSTNITI